MKTIITEIIPITEDIYSEKDYPMFKYFYLTKYKTKEDLIYHMDKKENYPLLNLLLSDHPDIKKIKYLPIFNEFTNYMVENYSFKISRDDAKTRILENEEIYKDDKFKKLFKNFIKVWNEIKSSAIKYKCREEMAVKTLSSKDPVIYFLNDNGELGFGMYIASACQNFISWQNTFLQRIIDSNGLEGILHYYVNNIKRKVPVQNAKPEQTLLIDERFDKSNYIDLIDVIYTFSERNIFNENRQINYSDYNSFKYDYDAIEEELGKIILPGVCLFESEDELNFVTFWSEGLRGGRSQMLIDFCSKYPQEELEIEEKKQITKYIIDKLPNNYDFKDFFGSLQMLIFYLTEKGNNKNDIKVNDVIEKAPQYLNLSDDLKNFFTNKENKINELSIYKIKNLFSFIEHFCFKDLIETLHIEYKKQIPEETKTKIKNSLLNIGNDPKDKFTIKDLGAAVRRFISRYLAGKLEVNDIKETRELVFELCREDLWDETILNKGDLQAFIEEKIKDFKLTVGEAYNFYELIGKEDKKVIEEYEKKKEDKKREKEKSEKILELEELLKGQDIGKTEEIMKEFKKKKKKK